MLEERRDIVLRRIHEDTVARLQEFGKAAQIAQVRLAGERPQTLFHAKVDLVAAEKIRIAAHVHKFDYRRDARRMVAKETRCEPASLRNQGEQ